ncbi:MULTISPECIES: DUF3025 domain-containing protein [Comamonas]|uniref:DUF3025 domain-containing protein n=1 Tax=Comamonas thiooxydans TaxID=363952 RepID=A0AA42PX76_9BURK|nr:MULTISPECIES: DUF3025 domain-containing protein [Comamonas]MDH1333307.1 DUF3025 domain-containing protein [Comamonas thiooxydans]MDH1738920.1 DUF3025 domain-containing protein [Comamonas thiooxydans]MDH1786177.1 DUF3025 domain-containing protein [Comamonas thiooxydans]TYK76959.1 DUF3025 domain-containing protein [Comamonas sp. Z1]
MQSVDWAIDWQAPWLAPLQALGRQVHDRVLGGAGVARALQEVAAAQGLLPGWQFVDQLQLPAGQAYEAFIHSRRSIPTRDNLHDFFNGLIWLHWPLLKQRLNALQAVEIARQGVGAQRGRLRDSITVLDENGGLLLAPQALCDALRDKRWQELFVARRALWEQARFLPIGHALLEKLVQPRKAITAHVICVPLEQAPRLASLAEADGWLDHQLRTQSCNLASKPYLPIPILGIPDWCLQNQNFSFYDDSLVFRAPRTAQTTQQRVLPERELA